jgi:hypothetical protein
MVIIPDIVQCRARLLESAVWNVADKTRHLHIRNDGDYQYLYVAERLRADIHVSGVIYIEILNLITDFKKG